MDDVRHRILAVIVAANGAATRLSEDDSLSGSGHFDSMAMLQIITRLEDAFGVRFEGDDLRLDHFDSVRAIEKLIRSKTKAGV